MGQKKLDNCEYPENSQFFDKTNKKVVGEFKDEACGVPITEFVGLRSTMYSYIKEDDKGGKTDKRHIKKCIKHEDDKNVLLNSRQMYHTMKLLEALIIDSIVTNWTKYHYLALMISAVYNQTGLSYAYGHFTQA